MIGWIWTRLLSGNHGVRTARQWLNHVLPTVLVLLRKIFALGALVVYCAKF